MKVLDEEIKFDNLGKGKKCFGKMDEMEIKAQVEVEGDEDQHDFDGFCCMMSIFFRICHPIEKI